MARVDLDLDDLTNAALKRLVKQLLSAEDGAEKQLLKAMGKKKPEKNDLADLDEEMHGKPRTPQVTEDDLVDEEDEE